MKRILSLLIVLFLFCGCSRAEINNSFSESFTEKISVSVDDYTYKAELKRIDNVIYYNVLNTNASGLTISCDGENVVFSKGEFINSCSIDNVSKYNLAVIFYNIVVKKYSMLDIGEYEITLTNDGKIESLSIPSSSINVTIDE